MRSPLSRLLILCALSHASTYTPWNLEADYFTSTLVGGSSGDADGERRAFLCFGELRAWLVGATSSLDAALDDEREASVSCTSI